MIINSVHSVAGDNFAASLSVIARILLEMSKSDFFW